MRSTRGRNSKGSKITGIEVLNNDENKVLLAKIPFNLSENLFLNMYHWYHGMVLNQNILLKYAYIMGIKGSLKKKILLFFSKVAPGANCNRKFLSFFLGLEKRI